MDILFKERTISHSAAPFPFSLTSPFHCTGRARGGRSLSELRLFSSVPLNSALAAFSFGEKRRRRRSAFRLSRVFIAFPFPPCACVRAAATPGHAVRRALTRAAVSSAAVVWSSARGATGKHEAQKERAREIFTALPTYFSLSLAFFLPLSFPFFFSVCFCLCPSAVPLVSPSALASGRGLGVEPLAYCSGRPLPNTLFLFLYSSPSPQLLLVPMLPLPAARCPNSLLPLSLVVCDARP